MVELEYAANLHLRHSNISFKIISYLPEEGLTVKVEQGKSMAENYLSAERLREETKFLFDRFLMNAIHVHANPYIPSPVEVVTPKWITDHMLLYKIKVKDISLSTGIDKTNISAWINEKRPMSQIVKALFFNFFKTHAMKYFIDAITDPNYNGLFFMKKYLDRGFIEKLMKLSISEITLTEDDNNYKFWIGKK